MKRFLQGLGVGILATTLVFTIAYYTIGNNKMSDAEIKSAAQKLGMVQATEAPLFSSGGESDGNQPAQNQQDEAVLPDAQENSGQEGQAPDEAGQEGQVPDEAAQEGQISEKTVQDNQIPEAAPQDDAVVNITINEGDGATAVSQRLQELGLVSDAVDFDRYLRSNSQTHTIQIGTFELRPGMSYEEISSIISSK